MLRQKSNLESSSSAMNNRELYDIRCEVGSTNENMLPELNACKSSNQWCENCLVCSKKFTGPEPYKQHLESQAHKRKVASLQNLDNNNEESLRSLTCEPCDKSFTGPEPYKQHLESQAHKKKIASLQNLDNNNEESLQSLICKPCDKSFSGIVPYELHMKSELHKKKLQNIQFKEQYLSKEDSPNSEAIENEIAGKIPRVKLWFCNICNKQCNGQTPYKEHITGIMHFKNEKKLKLLKDLTDRDIVLPTPTGIQSNIVNENNILEKPENALQLVENCQKEDKKGQNNILKRNVDATSVTQVRNLSENSLSDNSENMFQLTNSNNQSSNEKEQNDFVPSEEMNKLTAQSSNELEVVNIAFSDDTMDFKELDVAEILEKIQNNSKKNKKIHEDNENDLEPLKKKMKQETVVCPILQIGDELLFDDNNGNKMEDLSYMDRSGRNEGNISGDEESIELLQKCD